MDQSDDKSLTALLTKRDPVRFCEIVNTCTERREEKRIQRTAWILSHVLRTTLCEHVNGLCPAGWLNEQSITKHWFQSVRTCPYSWATGRNFDDFPSTTREWKCNFFSHTLRIFERSKVNSASGRAVDFGSFYAPVTINTLFSTSSTRDTKVSKTFAMLSIFLGSWK